jgi:hydrogenase maturation protein HypF
MPGGDQAIREPWRMALAHLQDAGCSDQLGKVPAEQKQVVRRMLERHFNTPLTSSAGRLFDAVAALAGVRQVVSFEGQAAMELEWLAATVAPDGSYPFDVSPAEQTLVIDTRPLIRAVVEDVGRADVAHIARRFHSTLVELIATVCGRLRDITGLETVVQSGGVFMNALLTSEVTARLTEEGFRVYRHRLVPPNDGGLSLGQLAIAAAQLERSD